MYFSKLFHFFATLCLVCAGFTIDATITEVVIVSTNDSSQAAYWQNVLDAETNESRKYIVVYEDWPDGADNGLGSLYAFTKADQCAQNTYHTSLSDVLSNNGIVALFHCAGMGKRLYPLTASENNNKSAVKIPGKESTQTILELILSHSLSLTSPLKGRLTVFWGDQIFIPTQQLSTPREHVSIFALAGDFPSEEVWKARNLDQYGLLIQNPHQTKLVEKTTYPNLVAMTSTMESPLSIGVSLGSFSISLEMLNELLATFPEELSEKAGKLNTDYHFWMPLTWSRDAYAEFMTAKGENRETILNIYDRIQALKHRLQAYDSRGIFGVQNVGENALWLDFGSVKSYYKNVMSLLTQDNGAIFGFNKEKYYDPQKNNILINCNIDEIEATNSILINVTGKKIHVDETILIDSSFNELIANQALGYNIKDENVVRLNPGDIRADVFLTYSPHPIALYSSMHHDPKAIWGVVLPKNRYSFEELYQLTNSSQTPL